jgi:hypothetical protein
MVMLVADWPDGKSEKLKAAIARIVLPGDGINVLIEAS